MNQFVKKDLIPPHRLALYFGVAAITGMVLAAVASDDPSPVWQMGISCLLLFSMANNALSFFAESYKYHLRNSLYSFFGLFAAILLVGYFCTGVSIQEAGSYKIIVAVVLIANFIFIGMILFVKGIFSMLGERDKRL